MFTHLPLSLLSTVRSLPPGALLPYLRAQERAGKTVPDEPRGHLGKEPPCWSSRPVTFSPAWDGLKA